MRTTLLAAVWLVGVVGICSPGSAEPRFRLTVLTSGPPLVTIDERDVVAFDGQTRRIVLRPEVSPRLLEAARKLPQVPDRLRRLKALWSTRDLGMILDSRGFAVSLDGQPFQAGSFGSGSPELSASLSTDRPVIHAFVDEDRRIVLDLSRKTANDMLIESLRRAFADLKIPAQAPPLPRVERPAPAQPVRIGATAYPQESNGLWVLFFLHPDDVSEVRYRPTWGKDGGRWDSFFKDGSALLGEIPPGRKKIDVEALDWAGEVVGRYVYWLDPARVPPDFRERVDLEIGQWVSFQDDKEGNRSRLQFEVLRRYQEALSEIRYSLDDCSLDRRFPLSFNGVRDAMREIRYSFDGCALDRRLPLRPWTRLGDVPGDSEDFLIRKVAAIRSVCVQPVFRDGETPEPRQYFRKPPPDPEVGIE